MLLYYVSVIHTPWEMYMHLHIIDIYISVICSLSFIVQNAIDYSVVREVYVCLYVCGLFKRIYGLRTLSKQDNIAS